MTAPSITSIATWGVIQTAVAAGADEATLRDAAGLASGPPELERHVAADRHLHVWEMAMQATSDPRLPIRAATAFDVSDLEVYGFLITTSETATEAFERSASYRRLYVQGSRWELSQYPDELRLTWYPWFSSHRFDVGRRCADEAVVVEMMASLRSITGRRALVPRAVTFAHAPIGDTSGLAAYFGIEPRFGAPLTELAFAPEVGRLPVASFNSKLRDYFDRQCRELIAKFASDRPTTLGVKKLLIVGMNGAMPDKDEIARHLGMSSRSLHRRLEEEGTTFLSLVDEVRCEIAKRYLARPSVSASEVAFLLGFSETSAFFRAFKRWTGVTPQQFRDGFGATA